jgi:hypothetical protein
MIALPLSLPEFVQFCTVLQESITRAIDASATAGSAVPATAPNEAHDVVQITQIAMLLLPFLLGFSTSVVLMIINRLWKEFSHSLAHGKPKFHAHHSRGPLGLLGGSWPSWAAGGPVDRQGTARVS